MDGGGQNPEMKRRAPGRRILGLHVKGELQRFGFDAGEPAVGKQHAVDVEHWRANGPSCRTKKWRMGTRASSVR